MSAQTIQVGAGRGIGSRWWVVVAVAIALIVALLLINAGFTGEKGRTTQTTRTGQVSPDQLSGGPAKFHQLP